MFLNNFSVRIPEGNELPGGYVELAHTQKYTLHLHNMRKVDCDAIIEIDGKSIGTFRLHANDTMRLERPPHDNGYFTFYKIGTQEAQQAQLNEGSPDLGLVKVTFIPAQEYKFTWATPIWHDGEEWQAHPSSLTGTTNVSYRSGSARVSAGGVSAGGTGLSGHSNQTFLDVGSIDRDYSQSTTIYLRLVAKNGLDKPRPLTQYSTPIPPRI